MSRTRRAILWMLELLEWVVGSLRQRLREEKERADEEAVRAAAGGFEDGAWVRVVANACPNCSKDHPPGSMARIKRFTTEARSEGEWVFDKPGTAFCCAAGLVLERAEPVREATP